MLRGIGADCQLAVRSLRTAPAVSVAAILTLALGIGATTAIFSVANGLALRPLPVKDPQQLVTLTSDTALRHGFQAGAGWSHAMWERLRQRADAFDGAFAWTLQRLDVSPGGEMQPINALVASGALFQTLGVHAAVGRTFGPVDDAPGGGPDGAVAVISHRLWQHRFAAAREVLSSRLLIEQVPVTVVGVAPAWFTGLDVGQPFDVAIPFATDALIRGSRSFMSSERALLLTVMLRLKPEQKMSEASAALRAMQPQIVGANTPAFLREPFIVVDASRGISDRSRLRQQYQRPLVILSIVSGIVLLIVCLNIASLLLSRAAARRSELGVRLALGAPRWRLARQPLVESLTLGTVGAAAGTLFAAWASRALVTQLPVTGNRISIDVSFDWRVFVFSAGVTVLAVVVCATVPALQATRAAPIEALRAAGRGAGGASTNLLSSGLVIAQIALSIVLLAGAGLFVRTLIRLVTVPLGFQPAGLLVVSVNRPPSTAEQGDPALQRQRLLEAVRTVPGVAQAAGSVWLPIGTGGGGLLTDARGRRAETVSRPIAFNFVTPGWFTTYRTPIRMGRDFDTRDASGAPRVAVVNEALRRSLLGEGEAVGATIHAGPCGSDGCTVVGVVADAVYGHSLRDAAPSTLYLPFAQSTGLVRPDAPFRISLRAAGDPAEVRARVAGRLLEVDPGATFTFRRLEEDLTAAMAQERLLAMLAAFFGVVALLLSAVGLYGLSSYAATRRRAEMGIRLLLGAQPHAVVRAILNRIALLVLAGIALGGLAALWLARFVASLLYGLEPHDPVTLVTAATILAGVAGVAAWFPAARATRIDPAQVLRDV